MTGNSNAQNIEYVLEIEFFGFGIYLIFVSCDLVIHSISPNNKDLSSAV